MMCNLGYGSLIVGMRVFHAQVIHISIYWDTFHAASYSPLSKTLCNEVSTHK